MFLLFLQCLTAFAQGELKIRSLVGDSLQFGTYSASPSSAFQFNSTTNGLLPPRMTKTQREAISSPADGLLVYQTDVSPGYYIYYNSAWNQVGLANMNLATVLQNGSDANSTQISNVLQLGINTTPSYPLHIKKDGTPQFYVQPASTTGQDAAISISGARNASTTSDHAQLHFLNYDNDLSASNYMGSIAGRVTNGTLNYGDLVFYNYTDGSTKSETMRLTSSGYVGIGTSAPKVKLMVDGGSDASLADGSGYFILGDESATNIVIDDNEIIARNNGAASTLYAQSEGGNFTVHYNAATTAFIVEDGGDVGIGTTNPITKLTIESSALNYTGGIDLSDGADDWYMHMGSSHELIFNKDGTFNMVIDASGNVGIGDATPNDKLHVYGSSSSTGVRTRIQNGSTGYSGLIVKNSNREFFLGCQGTGDYASGEFHIYDNTAGARRLVIDAAGNVGIGTSNPSELLHVNGVARSSSAFWVTTSDARAKQNIQPIDNALDIITKFNPVTFEWKESYHKDHQGLRELNYGFISQDVEKVLPIMITETVEVVGNDTITDFKLMDKDPLIALMVKSIQEQQQQIEQIQSNNELLTERIKALEAILEKMGYLPSEGEQSSK